MSRPQWWIFALMMMLAASCARDLELETTDPFHVPKQTFLRTTRIIGLAPLAIPDGLQDPQAVIDEFTTLIDTKLRSAGFSVLQPHQHTLVWQKVIAELGGLVDEDTGQRDEHKLTLAMVRTLDSLDADFSLDAALVARIEVVEASFASGRAQWDGTQQSIKMGAILRDFLAGSPEGKVGALSLRVTLYDMEDNILYDNAGGIGVLSKLDGAEFVIVPRQELFADKKRNKKAVDIALDPLSK